MESVLARLLELDDGLRADVVRAIPCACVDSESPGNALSELATVGAHPESILELIEYLVDDDNLRVASMRFAEVLKQHRILIRWYYQKSQELITRIRDDIPREVVEHNARQLDMAFQIAESFFTSECEARMLRLFQNVPQDACRYFIRYARRMAFNMEAKWTYYHNDFLMQWIEWRFNDNNDAVMAWAREHSFCDLPAPNENEAEIIIDGLPTSPGVLKSSLFFRKAMENECVPIEVNLSVACYMFDARHVSD